MISEVVRRVADRAVVDSAATAATTHWGDFILAQGLIEVWEASGDPRYLDAARSIVDAYEERGPSWETIMWRWAGISLPSLILFSKTGAERHRQFGLAIVQRLLDETKKTSDGGITSQREESQLWVDLLYFACPVLCELAVVTRNPAYLDEATHQFNVFTDRLADSSSQLFHHAWDESTGTNSKHAWARGNSWVTATCVEMLERLPEGNAGRRRVAEVLSGQVEAVCGLQDASGLWHTVIDRPDSYLETSASSIFAFAIARGARLGFIDRKWLENAMRAWWGLQNKVSHDGQVFDVSGGTPPGDFDHYQNVPRGVHSYGTGFFLRLGVEVNEL